MDHWAHQSKKSNVLEVQAHGKTMGTHQEASWAKAVATGGTHWSADQGVWPTGGPHHRPPAFKCSFMAASLSRFTKLPCCKRRLKTHMLLPINIRGGGARIGHTQHTPHLSFFTWILGVLSRNLGSLGG